MTATSRIIKPALALRAYWIGAVITTTALIVSLLTSRLDTLAAGYYLFLAHLVVFLWTLVVLAQFGPAGKSRMIGTVIASFAIEGLLFVARYLRDFPVG